ncbi:MAG TPA: phosphoribosyltransferase family protein, partial [Actinomycetota bacterium]|nr:phosphoribosyltransferase family protein [Actinomycetota bacterium]
MEDRHDDHPPETGAHASIGRRLFADRVEAGDRLAEALAERVIEPVVVLGVPRGGVIVADRVARRLGAALDVVVPRKLGA